MTDHLLYLQIIFELLKEHRLVAKRSKCAFGIPQVEYLGHVISKEGVATDPKKIQAVRDWPEPKTVKQLRGFLGLTGYYRRFVKNYGSISKPLTQLLKKDAFIWQEEALTAFNALKQAMIQPPVLSLPDLNLPFVVETDASGSGLGAVLMQAGHPIAFISKALGPRQQALCSSSEVFSLTLSTISTKLLEEIQASWTTDTNLAGIISQLQQDPNSHPHYAWTNGHLYRKGKLVVGNNPDLQRQLISLYHDSALGGHSGITATIKRVGQQRTLKKNNTINVFSSFSVSSLSLLILFSIICILKCLHANQKIPNYPSYTTQLPPNRFSQNSACNKILTKLVQIMRERVLYHLRKLPPVVESWNIPVDTDSQPSLIAKEILKLFGENLQHVNNPQSDSCYIDVYKCSTHYINFEVNYLQRILSRTLHEADIQAIFRQVVIDLHKETSEAFSQFEISSPQAKGRLHRDITLILECVRSLPSGSSSKFDTLNRGQLDEFFQQRFGSEAGYAFFKNQIGCS
ncbi:hypothetical protein DKX38_026106 [Salix brachista]|uniref:Reverse transcriptase/retrotransposon-derived protein RNase H-like domain-containing protein n=1 Tax=Salix brachista TaxID=2182728 RepID=A0A5N5K3F5_9ROSI|nr:hypothetical protein DKX38_026106 [Salix brachista]